MKTNELIGPALDWAVAKCEGLVPNVVQEMAGPFIAYSVMNGRSWIEYRPSTDWSQGGPIIEREGLYLKARNDAKEWKAGALSMNRPDNKPGPLYNGPAPLIAAMRCYVASKLGDEIKIPKELK